MTLGIEPDLNYQMVTNTHLFKQLWVLINNQKAFDIDQKCVILKYRYGLSYFGYEKHIYADTRKYLHYSHC